MPINPLLDFTGLPRFGEIKPEHVTPAIDALLAENRALVARLTQDQEAPTWENVVRPLHDANELLNRAWGQVEHLNAVMNSPELRDAYNENLPKLTQYFSELSTDRGMFSRFKLLRAAPGFEALSSEQKKVLENELRDFRLGGAELPETERARYLELSEGLASLSSRFSDNLLDATNGFAHYTQSRHEVRGLPDDVLEAAAEAAKEDGASGWKFTLHAPSYSPAMQYAENRELRETMYRAYVTRASEFGKPEWDNTEPMAEILRLRRELAALLDFDSYAAYSLEPKMAKSPQQVLDFLHQLADQAKPYAERDLAELRDFAGQELGLGDLQAWDVGFASEKLRVSRYAFSEQEVKQYFPEDHVLLGMFKLVETLYGLRITPWTAPVWHADARFYRITDAAGELIGHFYVDLYARPSKRGGAWMDDAITRRRKGASMQTPVAYLNCNFSPPLAGRPALFTHDEVITLFHEFGHGLHHLLTNVEELGVSGINGVEWDAVELPSQFMENFCWEWEVLRHMTRHVETGKPLGRQLFDKMLAAKNFQSGLHTVRQLEFALFDMLLHHRFNPEGEHTLAQLLDQVRNRVAVIFPPDFNRFPNSFSHIFAGGYAAGYYSYKWAEVLSADAYSLFEEEGVLNSETGARFRREILGAGGSRPALDSFIAFRGREPSIEALLRHSGMVG
jgi:oligopeptidase A